MNILLHSWLGVKEERWMIHLFIMAEEPWPYLRVPSMKNVVNMAKMKNRLL